MPDPIRPWPALDGAALISLSVLSPAGLQAQATTAETTPAPQAPTGRTARAMGEAVEQMAAAANPLAARAGLDILRAGSSAMEAAIAVQLVLHLVEPQSPGIGGGAFLLHWDEGRRELVTLDGRGEARPLPRSRWRAHGVHGGRGGRALGRRAGHCAPHG